MAGTLEKDENEKFKPLYKKGGVIQRNLSKLNKKTSELSFDKFLAKKLRFSLKLTYTFIPCINITGLFYDVDTHLYL